MTRKRRSLQQLLTRFETVTPNDRQAEAFRRQFADAYLRRVRDERASGNWNNARALLNAASSLFPSAESASAIEAERARIASDEEAVQQRVTATDTTTRVAQLQQQIASAMATAASIADARRIRSMAASLAKLDPDNPQLTGVDVLLQQKLISAAFARAERSGSWHASLVLIEQATELFAAATIVAEAHAVIEERYQRELATARSARLAETTASIDDLLAGAPTPPDWRFSEQLVNALADLTSLLPEGSSLRDDYVAKAAAVYVNAAGDLRRAQRFALAESVLDLANTVVPEAPAIQTERETLNSASTAFAEQRRQEAEIARVNALRRNFQAHIGAREIASAEASLTEIRKELATDDSFLTEDAPAALAGALHSLAQQAVESNDYDAALGYASKGLDYRSGHPDLLTLIADIEEKKRFADTEPAKQRSLSEQDLIGSWCGGNTQLIFAPTSMTFVLPDGKRLSYPVSSYQTAEERVAVFWNDGELGKMVTEFGGVASQFAEIVQLRGREVSATGWNEYNRRFTRCD